MVRDALALYLLILPTSILSAAEFQGLGDLPGGEFNSVAQGVSADGSIVVGGSHSDIDSTRNRAEAFAWQEEQGIVGIGRLPATRPSSRATAISSDGSTAVGGSWSGEATVAGSVAVRWTNHSGEWQIQQLLDGSHEPPFRDYYAIAVSKDGSTIAGSGVYLPDGKTSYYEGGFTWTEVSGMNYLPRVPWYDDSQIIRVRGISEDGSVVAANSMDTARGGINTYTSRAFVWDSTEGITEIARGSGVLSTDARAVSADGQTVVGNMYVQEADGIVRNALWWQDGIGTVDLGRIPAPTAWSSGLLALSANGDVAGGQAWVESGITAVIWDRYHGLRNLQDLLETEYGMQAQLEGWQLDRVRAVSENGLVLTGEGINPMGQVEAWRVTLDESAFAPGTVGDTNLDGTIDFEDFLRLSTSYQRGNFWYQGDFDGNYRVDDEDFSLLTQNFGKGSSADLHDLKPVPEPMGLPLLVFGSGIMLALARKKLPRRPGHSKQLEEILGLHLDSGK